MGLLCVFLGKCGFVCRAGIHIERGKGKLRRKQQELLAFGHVVGPIGLDSQGEVCIRNVLGDNKGECSRIQIPLLPLHFNTQLIITAWLT